MELNRAELAAVDGVEAELLDACGRLVITPNFATLEGQRNVPADLLPGESLASFLERHVPGIHSGAWAVSIARRTVPPAMWSRTFPKHGMLIACRATAGKQVVAIIAIAVLTFFSAGIAAGIYGAVGGTFVAASAGATLAAIQAGVVIAGTALINKVLAPKVPSASSAPGARAIYSLSGQRNSVRPYQPIPTLWGEMRVTPDAASAAYTWFEGDEQYLSLILLGGVNVHTASDFTVGDSPLSGYSDVTVFCSGFPGMASQDIPLYSNADSITGAELENDGAWVTRTSSPDAIALQFDFEGQLYDIGGKGQTQTNSVPVYIETRPVGTSDWSPALTQTLTNATADVMRRTFTVQVAKGQYEVRVRLGAPTWDQGEGKDQCKIGWNVLRTIQPDETDYSDWGRIGIKIKASGQISGSLDTVRATYRARPMPIWNGLAWATATTREDGLSNPGAILLQTMRGVYANGELQFGFGLPDEQIDIEGLKAFMLHCTANGYTYDKWVTDAVSLGQFCQEVALAGMGEFSWTDGSRPTAVFVSSGQPLSGVANMATMLKASFEVSYSLSNAADGIEYQYLDRDRNWETQTLRVAAPGVTTMLNPARITGEGVTSEAHAAIMARYHLAQSLYQFKTISYTADIEHLDYRRLSLLSISHDLTQWGYGGRLMSAQTVAGKVVLQLDEPVPPMPQAFIGVRLPGYRDYRVFQVEALAAASDQVTLADPWPAGLPLPGATTDDPAHDTLWCYDFKPTPGYRVRVVSMEPEADLKGARISCVPEGPEFWDYVINGNYVPAPNGSSLTANLPVASGLQITRSRVKVGAGWEHELSATWDVTGNYDHAQVWAGPVGQPLVLIDSNVYGTRLAWRVPSDTTWSVEVRPFDGLGRMGTAASIIFVDPSVVVGEVVGLAAFVETNGIVLRWSAPQGIDAIDYATTRIRRGLAGATWETATPAFEGRTDSVNLGWLQAGTHVFFASHINTAGDESVPVSTALLIEAPSQPIVTGKAFGLQAELYWTNSAGTQPLRHYEVRVGPIYNEADVRTTTDALGYIYSTPSAGVYMHWVTAIDMGGNRSAPGYVEITTLPDIGEAIAELEEGLDEAVLAIGANTADIGVINAQLADIAGAAEWDVGATYSEGGIVKHDGGLFRSLQDGNVGHAPDTSPTWWQKIGDYDTLGEAVAAHAVQLSEQATRIEATEDGLQAQTERVDLLATTVTTAQQQAINAAVQEEAEALSSEIAAEAQARQQVVANITSASSANLVTNPTFDPAGWRYAADPTIATDYFARGGAGVPAGAPSARVLRLTKGTALGVWSGHNMRFGISAATLAEARPGEIVDFSVSVWAPTGTTSNAVHVQMFAVDAANALIAGTLTTRSYNGAAGGWQVLSGVLTLPAGTVAFAGHFAIGDAAPAGQVMWVAEPDVRKRSASALVLGASVATTSQALATLDGKVAASYTVSVQAGNLVAGIRLGTDGATSDFVVLSHKFAWAYQATGEVKYGFVAGLINGVPSFGLNGNMFIDGTVMARMVGADQIRGTHIRGEEIEGRHVKTGSLTADKAAFGVSANLIPNSVLVTDSGWFADNGNIGTACVLALDYPDANWRPAGGHALCIHQPNEVNAGANLVAQWYTESIPVEGGKRYQFSGYTAAHRCTAYVMVAFYDAGGTYLGEWNASEMNAATHGGGVALSGYKRLGGFVTCPASSASCRFFLRKFPTHPGGGNSYAWLTQPMLAAAGAYQTALSEYAAAGVGTFIDESGIRTSSLGALSRDLGLVVYGRMVSADGRMTIDLDGKSLYMLSAGRRVELSPNSGFYVGDDAGAGNFLRYNINTGQLLLRGAFTADTINAVSTLNIAGGAVTTKRFASSGGLASQGITMVAGSSGVVIRGVVHVTIVPVGEGNPAELTVGIYRDASNSELSTARVGLPIGGQQIRMSIPLDAFDAAPIAGWNTYSLRFIGPSSGQLHGSTITLEGGQR
jgi:hypothetical protein